MDNRFAYADSDVESLVFEIAEANKYSDAQARDDHGRWTSGGAPSGALEIPQNPFVREDNLVSATAPHVGLSPKAKDVASRISNVQTTTEIVLDSPLYTHTADYVSASGNKFQLTLEESHTRLGSVQGEVKAFANGKEAGGLKYSSIRTDYGLDNLPAKPSRIEFAGVGPEFRSNALATAMLEFARRQSTTAVLHSKQTTPEGTAFAESTKYTESQARDDHGRWTSGGGYPTWDDISEGQQSALTEYQSSGYAAINEYLRTGTHEDFWDGPVSDDPELDRHITNLDGLISTVPPLSKDTTLYRGVSGNLANKLLTLKPGDSFEDKGYSSTSYEKSVATQFALGGATVIIKAPKGTKSFDVDKFFDEAYEGEVILPRGSKFTVDSVKGNEVFVRVANG